MTAIKDLKKRLNNFAKLNANTIVHQIVAQPEFREWAINLIRVKQLFEKGEDGLGKTLRSEFAIGGAVYSTATEIIKQAKNQKTDVVTLRDSGEFYNSFRLHVARDGFQVDADTRKSDNDLIDVWGEDILSFNEENLQLIINRIANEMVPMVQKILREG